MRPSTSCSAEYMCSKSPMTVVFHLMLVVSAGGAMGTRMVRRTLGVRQLEAPTVNAPRSKFEDSYSAHRTDSVRYSVYTAARFHP